MDGHLADFLFGDRSAEPLLQRSRKAKLISFVTPFAEVAQAANPYGIQTGELPAFLGQLIGAWAFRVSHPSFSVAKQRDCIAARFPAPIAIDRIEKIIDIDDAELA